MSGMWTGTWSAIWGGPAGLFFLGFITGSTICSLSCLPYLGPYLLSTGRGFRDGLLAASPFMLGKVCAYTAMSGFVAWLGTALDPEDARLFRMLGAWCMVVAGLALPLFGRKNCCRTNRRVERGTLLYLIGLTTSFSPCLPLAGLFALAAQTGSVKTGLLYGLLYSTGLVIIPTVLTGGVLGLIAGTLRDKARAFLPILQGLSALVMVLTGIQMLRFLQGS